MRLAVVVFAALLTVSIVACGGGSEVATDAQTSANASDVTQDQFRFLAEGEFIDSEPIGGGGGAWISIPGGLPGVVSRADAVVVAEITEVVDIIERTRPAAPNFPAAEVEDYPLTIYSARVEQWVKGSGADEITITQFGGVTASGPRFTDGDFLLQPGRRYVVALMDKDKLDDIPGPGGYVKRGLGFGAFEVTDGFVHVLNNPLTQELQALYGGMVLADFVQVLEGYVANPPPSPTPLAGTTPQPPDTGPAGSSLLVIDTVAVDTDINAGAANTATSLGRRIACNTLKTGEALTIDVTVDTVPPVGDDGGGIAGFQFVLVYDRSNVTVSALEHDMLLAAKPGSGLIPISDTTPDTDGSLRVAAVDFGDATTPESGSGVLARVTLEGVGPGVSDLTLTDVIIVDDLGQPYSIDNVLAAQVAVGTPCPAS